MALVVYTQDLCSLTYPMKNSISNLEWKSAGAVCDCLQQGSSVTSVVLRENGLEFS